MTRSEFIEEVTTFWELRDFCREHDIYVTDDFFDGDDLSEEVEYDLSETDAGWRDIRDWLSEIDDSYDFYERCGRFDYYGYNNGDDKFLELKEEALLRADEEELFEEDEEDDDTEQNIKLEEFWFGKEAV